MKYLTSEEVAEKKGLSIRRIQQMCRDGGFDGAYKEGKSWLIPDDVLEYSFDSKRLLPVGLSDFKRACNSYYYVDKTLFIRDFLDSAPLVSLITRPRRFGKTLNMDMLRVFFEKTNEDTSIYFKDKKIWNCGEKYTKHQGQYPVIYLTFKDVKCLSWQDTIIKIKQLIRSEFIRHIELATSLKINEYDREEYKIFANGEFNEVECQNGLQLLSLLLHKHYEKKCIVIIDEYDVPIQQGHQSNFYPEIINFMRNFFSGGFKDNPHLEYGFLTGILKVAKESIFSGMNNLKCYSILDETYSEYFGFTQDEVKDMLTYYGRNDKYDEVCKWYDGYKFGDVEIFNPWSVINYLSDKCFPKAFWQLTGSNDIIKEVLPSASNEVTKGLKDLLMGNKLTTYIDLDVIYPEISANPYTIYSFLLVTGYLKVISIYPLNDGNYMCEVAIPNKEINHVYKKEILDYTNNNGVAISIEQAIFSKDSKKLESILEKFLLESVSSFDCANESFYHGLMLGLCSILGNQYQLRSNRESGLGRFDLQLLPLVKDLPGFIFEFKHTKNDKDDLDELASLALSQIDDKKYDTELISNDVKQIIQIGIAFRGKETAVKQKQ